MPVSNNGCTIASFKTPITTLPITEISGLPSGLRQFIFTSSTLSADKDALTLMAFSEVACLHADAAPTIQ